MWEPDTQQEGRNFSKATQEHPAFSPLWSLHPKIGPLCPTQVGSRLSTSKAKAAEESHHVSKILPTFDLSLSVVIGLGGPWLGLSCSRFLMMYGNTLDTLLCGENWTRELFTMFLVLPHNASACSPWGSIPDSQAWGAKFMPQHDVCQSNALVLFISHSLTQKINK